MTSSLSRLILATLTACALLTAQAQAADVVAPLMRFPTVSASAVAFVARGDLWIAPRDGGRAVRLVQGGVISAARFSPDGRWIAYTDRRGGGQDAWVVPAAGGAPRRLTFDAGPRPEDDLVSGWTPDGARVVFLSHRGAWAAKVLRAFTVALGGGAAELLPLGQTGLVSFAPDGRILALTRSFTNLAARKRYLGGQAQDVFTYDLGSHALARITDWRGTDTAPMWAGRRIYFLSDRGAGFRLNLWCYDLDTRATRQVTRFADYDVDWPSLGGGRIVFQQGGRLWALDVPSERLHPVAVDVPDDGAAIRPRVQDVSREAQAADVTGAVDYTIAPRGEAALVSAHGDIFRIDARGGARNLTSTPAVDEEHPSWSPDGRTVAYVTEAHGAEQVAVRPAEGGAERRLTRFTSGVLYAPRWSPDGRALAVADAEHDLWWVQATGAAVRLVARDPAAEIRDAAFSPDGRRMAYSTQRATGLRALHVQELASGRDVVLSSPMESDRLPAFSADGRTLYFVSARHELPFTSDRDDEATVSTLKSDGLYAAPLTPAIGEAALDLSGVMARATALPVAPARIVSLEVRGGLVVYETRPPALLDGELPGETAALHAFDPATGADKVLVAGLDDHALSADGGHVLYRRGGGWRLADLATGGDTELATAGLAAPVDPRAEWAEMFERAWRLDRDLFFSRVMNGDDWRGVHDAYARLLPRLGSRQDLLYLLGELQGELATSHAFISGLDAGDPGPSVRPPRLGADLALDPASGRYRFTRIFRGDPTRERFRSPLGAPGLDVREGDYLLAVDGRDLRAPVAPDALLAAATAAADLTLTVSTRPDGPGRPVRVTPLADDLDLRQHDWVEANRARVAALTGGRVGYVFLSDFNAAGSQDLVRQLQPQLDREGLVIDVRWNRGGFTSQAVLGLLKRVRVGSFVNREGALEPLPLFTAPRAMALVADAFTGSDGDQFTYFFRHDGLGPVVGQRTWGGVQGIKGPWPLMDGTTLTIPKDSLASDDGRWLIENVGAAPDIAVDPDLDEDATGRDLLLETAARTAAAVLARDPPSKPAAPAPNPAYPPAGDVPGARVSSPG